MFLFPFDQTQLFVGLPTAGSPAALGDAHMGLGTSVPPALGPVPPRATVQQYTDF